MASNNKTSILVADQLPQFVKDDHPKFIQFLEKYYEFLEQEGQMLDVSKNLTNNMNIDMADEVFQEKIYNQFLKLLTVNVLADKTTLIKYIKDFYRAKGTENAVRFLARILFNKEIEFYYPKTDILRASDGKWYIEKSLRITDIAVNNVSNSIAIMNFKNKTIRGGASSNATAAVETIDVYYDKGDLVAELKISGINREFESEEPIFCYFTEEGSDKRLSANIYSGIITSVKVIDKGTGYIEGTTVPLISPTGRNGEIRINRVSKGTLKGIGITFGGAGYVANDEILVTTSYAGGGAGASGKVNTVDLTERYHPNTYQFVGSTISQEENTILSNVIFSNLNSSNIYTTIANAMQYWTYANCGPILTGVVTNAGQDYNILPSLSVKGNTYIRSLGMIGRVGVVTGGFNYNVGDPVEFINPVGSYGTGAHAEVSNVAANGAITEVKVIAIPGHLAGGAGYERNNPPTPFANSNAGYGATLKVDAFLAYDEHMRPITDDIGAIEELIIISGGTGYLEPPTLNLAAIGDGTANANATVARVLYIYPGRYLNDDGHLSSYNFIQDRDYYQNYSYVVKIDESLNKYREPLKNLTHPLGMKLFGEYTYTNDTVISEALLPGDTEQTVFGGGNYEVLYNDASYNVNVRNVTYSPITYTGVPYKANNQYKNATYGANGNNISVFSFFHRLQANDYVYMSFTSNGSANLVDGIYTVTSSNTNYFSLVNPNTVNNVVGTAIVYDPRIIVTANNRLLPGQNVFMVFDAVDPYLTQQEYGVVTANSTQFAVVDENIPDIFVDAGNVNVWTSHVNVSSNLHGFITGDKTYITFRTGDMANVVNGYATVFEATTNTFVLHETGPVYAGGNAEIFIKQLTFTSANTNLANNESIKVWFKTGDLSNTIDKVYTVNPIDANTFNITAPQITIANGTAALFINRSTLLVNQKDHGYSDNNRIYMEFTTGELAAIPNGIFRIVNVSDTDTFTVYRNDLVAANATVFTATANVGKVQTALYKVV